MNILEKIKEFQVSGMEEMTPTKQVLKLKNSLLLEELSEFEEAVINGDRVEELDAIVDFMYVLGGFQNILEQGHKEPLNDIHITGVLDKPYHILQEIKVLLSSPIKSRYVLEMINYLWSSIHFIRDWTPEVIDEAFNRVHKSNMSKFFSFEQAVEVKDAYDEEGIETYLIRNDLGTYTVKRSSDDKTMKGHLYTPVDLTDLI